MGIAQIDLAILLPAFAAAWNLAGGQAFTAPLKRLSRTHRTPDGYFTVEAPSEWALGKEEEANELTFVNGDISVNIAAVEAEDGDTIDQILEINKSLLRHLCPAGDLVRRCGYDCRRSWGLFHHVLPRSADTNDCSSLGGTLPKTNHYLQDGGALRGTAYRSEHNRRHDGEHKNRPQIAAGRRVTQNILLSESFSLHFSHSYMRGWSTTKPV